MPLTAVDISEKGYSMVDYRVACEFVDVDKLLEDFWNDFEAARKESQHE